MNNYPRQDRKVHLPKEKIGNRYVTRYDPTVALQIVERLAEGETLATICTLDNKMPTRTTFMKWVAREPELQKAWLAARELSAMAMEEEALGTARTLLQSPGTAQNVRAAEISINQLRWSASRRDPKNFGDKGLASTIVPIHISTTLNMGENAKQMDTEIADIYTIDITPNPEPTPKPLIEKYDPHAPRKRVLTPRNGFSKVTSESKEGKINGEPV